MPIRQTVLPSSYSKRDEVRVSMHMFGSMACDCSKLKEYLHTPGPETQAPTAEASLKLVKIGLISNVDVFSSLPNATQ